MNKKTEEEIIAIIKKDVEEFGNCSIKQAAHKSLNNNISMIEQKKLAKLIVKTNPFVTEIKNGKIIVKNNHLLNENKGDLFDKNKVMIYVIILGLASALSYYLLKVFLPSLSK